MDDWEGLRTAAVIVVWVTVAGGVLLAAAWFLAGGARAYGPEDEFAGRSPAPTPGRQGITSFSTAHVLGHAVLAILAASAVTYFAAKPAEAPGGYLTPLLALVVTGVPGAIMFHKWRTGDRPEHGAEAAGAAPRERVEDRLPGPVVYLHGLLALAAVLLVVILFVVD